MNVTKTYLEAGEASVRLERYRELNPFAKSLVGIDAIRLGHHSATLCIYQDLRLKDSSGAIDAGAMMAVMTVAVSLVASTSVAPSKKWEIKDLTLSQVARETRGALRLVAESEEVDWTSPGNKIVRINVYLDSRLGSLNACATGEAVVLIA